MLHNITLSCDLMWNLVRRSLLYCNYCMQYNLCIMWSYTMYISLQVYKRNPLCGINYPCGPARTNACIPLGNDSNYTNTSLLFNDTEDMIFSTTDSPTIMGGMMLNSTETMLPRGFRICNQPNTALWSTTLALCTFLIAVLLRKLRQGKFLGKAVSEIVFSSHCHGNQFFITETHEGSRWSLVKEDLLCVTFQGIHVIWTNS